METHKSLTLMPVKNSVLCSLIQLLSVNSADMHQILNLEGDRKSSIAFENHELLTC